MVSTAHYMNYPMTFGIKIINKLRHHRLSVREWASTRYMYAFSYTYGIRLGRNCRFWKRPVFYKELGSTIEIGDACIFRSDFDSNLIGVAHKCIISTHSPNAEIKIGNSCGFSGTSIGIKESLVIGNNVQVGANTCITDFDWHAMDPEDRDNPDLILSKGVVIEDNVWLGLNCIVLKGVRIGKNSIIGAGSVVTRDIASDSLAAGTPCRVLKKLTYPSSTALGDSANSPAEIETDLTESAS
jgi:acetyltransferase-like isoleucine patch superfamily enzyme